MMPAKAKTMTRTMATSAEFGFASWSAPEVSWTIEYPLEVMDEIRAYACNELLQLSHGGAEVAGVMFGSKRPGVIRILTWRPIASEYADGDTLRLSHRDRMNLAVQLEVARANPELKDLRPVGWFVSHPHGAVAMNSSDLEVHSGFFPESAQVTLVMRPTEGGRADAGFFVREADGSVRSEASYRNFELEPVSAPSVQGLPAEAPAAESLPAAKVSPEIEPVPDKVPAAPSQKEPAPRLIAASEPRYVPGPRLAAPKISPSNPAVPSFQIDEPLPAHERWLWAIPIALALGLAGWLLLHARQKPAEGAPIKFHISSNAAPTVQLEWDRNSQSVRDSERGEIDITDGGKSSQVSLTTDQLHSGSLAYVRQSSDVGFQLTVYPKGGTPVHENARLIAPASNMPTQPPELLTPAASSAREDSLQRQVRQLHDELGKERARSSELQNLVRILENRLGMRPEAPKAGTRP